MMHEHDLAFPPVAHIVADIDELEAEELARLAMSRVPRGSAGAYVVGLSAGATLPHLPHAGLRT